jgi:nitroreductase
MILSPEHMLAAITWRYATKKFDPARLIPTDAWSALEASMVLTPSSFGLQPWKFLVVKNPEIRKQLAAESWNQSQVTEASHFVVLTSRDDLTGEDIRSWIDQMAAVQGNPPESLASYQEIVEGFAASMTPDSRRAWNTRQVYIALGQLMTAAAFIGIDSCPMEGINPAGYDRILGLTGSGYSTAVGCALGYRSADDKYAASPKIRYSPERIVCTVM